MSLIRISGLWFACLMSGCSQTPANGVPEVIQPRVVSEAVDHDSDDPAIWINRADPTASLVLGTDKDSEGGLYAFNLEGKIVKKVSSLKRPNNVDVLTGFLLDGKAVDIAVLTEREAQRLRVFRLPDLEPLDRGDLVVFDGDKERAPMGIALYQRPTDHVSFAIVGGKSGPKEGYLWQYRLEGDGQGKVKMTLARKFGAFSGTKEIEAIAVDAASGSVYYSDERFGIREYPADPDAPNSSREISISGKDGFLKDREGISIYPIQPDSGYLLVSDQDAGTFRIFDRNRESSSPAEHRLVKVVRVAAKECDGSDATNVALGPRFPSGMLVAMSTDRTFHFYSWGDLAGKDLRRASQELPVSSDSRRK